MGDCRRVLRVSQSSDPVESVLVVNGHPLVLTEMFLPGGNHELLDNPVRISRVLPDAPRRGAGPAAAASGGLQRGDQLFGVSVNWVIPHTHRHGTRWRGIRRQFGLGPIALQVRDPASG
jgi:hypothetical protein